MVKLLSDKQLLADAINRAIRNGDKEMFEKSLDNLITLLDIKILINKLTTEFFKTYKNI